MTSYRIGLKNIFIFLPIFFVIAVRILSVESIAQTQEELDQSLYDATVEGKLEIVNELIFKGANINTHNKDGLTALMGASAYGQLDIFNELLNKGADINIIDNDGYSSLIYASANGYSDIAKDLIRRGADVNVKSSKGFTSLIGASMSGSSELVQDLINNGANVNARDFQGVTPLIMATGEGYSDIVSILISNGAEVNVKADNGYTSLLLASETGNTEIVELLLAAGADVNAKDDDGWTAMDIASQNSQDKMVELLEESGAKFEVTELKDLVVNLTVLIVPKGGYLEVDENGQLVPKNVENFGGNVGLSVTINNKEFGTGNSIIGYEIIGEKTFYKCDNGESFYIVGQNEYQPKLGKGEPESLDAQEAIYNLRINRKPNSAMWILWKVISYRGNK